MFKIIYTKKATKNLWEIFTYISLDNPLYAIKVLKDIQFSITYLQSFPFLWKEIKNWYREIVAKHKYRVIYKIQENTVYIVSIFKYKDKF